MNKGIIIGLVVVVGVVAFFGGSAYGKSKTASAQQARIAQFGGRGGMGGMRGANGGGFTAGDIIAKDATSITIKMRDGSTKIVFYSDTTEVGKMVSGTAADLAVGKTVTVMGKANADGSITAQSLQLRPALPSPSPSAQ